MAVGGAGGVVVAHVVGKAVIPPAAFIRNGIGLAAVVVAGGGLVAVGGAGGVVVAHVVGELVIPPAAFIRNGVGGAAAKVTPCRLGAVFHAGGVVVADIIGKAVPHDRRDIIILGKGQSVFGICIKKIGIVLIQYAVHIISVPCGAAVVTRKEQTAVCTHGTRIGVGDVDQIVAAVLHGHDVPHMIFAVHRAGDKVTLGILQIRQVTQILEGLGIPLAHHIGGAVAVQHIDQLPRIVVHAERNRRSVGRIIVVRDPAADLVPIGHQFFIVALVLVGLHDRFGGIDSLPHSCHIIGHDHIVVAIAIVFGNCKNVVYSGDPCFLGIERIIHTRAHTVRLIKPVQLVRAVVKQRGHQLVTVHLLGILCINVCAFGIFILQAGNVGHVHLDQRPAAVGCDILQPLLQDVVNLLFLLVQHFPRHRAEHLEPAEKGLIHVSGKQLIVTRKFFQQLRGNRSDFGCLRFPAFGLHRKSRRRRRRQQHQQCQQQCHCSFHCFLLQNKVGKTNRYDIILPINTEGQRNTICYYIVYHSYVSKSNVDTSQTTAAAFP